VEAIGRQRAVNGNDEENEMATRDGNGSRALTARSTKADEAPEPARKQPEHRFHLQVDRQTKASYATYEAAEKAGLAIKKEHPVVQVSVYDAVQGVKKILELSK
jgi:hypothetical protein